MSSSQKPSLKTFKKAIFQSLTITSLQGHNDKNLTDISAVSKDANVEELQGQKSNSNNVQKVTGSQPLPIKLPRL